MFRNCRSSLHGRRSFSSTSSLALLRHWRKVDVSSSTQSCWKQCAPLCSLLVHKLGLSFLYHRRPSISQAQTSQSESFDDSSNNSSSNPSPGGPSSSQQQPDLMKFPHIIWPALLHTIRNWFFANLIIKPYFDPEFSIQAFKDGAKQAIISVSEDLANSNLSALHDRISDAALEEIRRNFSLFTLKQKLDLAVALDDIFFSFPYQIGVIFKREGKSSSERVFVEITMCYHIFRGFTDFLNDKSEAKPNGSFSPYEVYIEQDRISIANYRFIREFTKGVEDDWTINIVNHFKPSQHIRQ